jgi:hypothetical protein
MTDVHSPLLFAFCLFLISCHKSFAPPSRDLNVGLHTFLTSSSLLSEIFLYSLPCLLQITIHNHTIIYQFVLQKFLMLCY